MRETRLRPLETRAKAAKTEAKIDESPIKLGLVEVPSSIHNSKSKAEAKKHPKAENLTINYIGSSKKELLKVQSSKAEKKCGTSSKKTRLPSLIPKISPIKNFEPDFASPIRP